MEGGEKEGESWLKEPEELRGMILSKRKNPESPSDARKIRKAKNSEIRERLTKTPGQNVEAEMRRAEGKQKSGLEKAEAPRNVGMSDSEMGKNTAPGRIRGQVRL